MKIDSKVTSAFGMVFAHTTPGLTYFNQWGSVVLITINPDTSTKSAVTMMNGKLYTPTHGELFRPVKTKVVFDEDWG